MPVETGWPRDGWGEMGVKSGLLGLGLVPGQWHGLVPKVVDYAQVRTKGLYVNEWGIPMGTGGPKESLGKGVGSVGQTSSKV